MFQYNVSVHSVPLLPTVPVQLAGLHTLMALEIIYKYQTTPHLTLATHGQLSAGITRYAE